MDTGLRRAKTAIKHQKSQKKTDRKEKQPPKNRVQGAADTLKNEKSARKAGKRAENYEETAKKLRRNGKIEQKKEESTAVNKAKNSAKIR